MKQATPWKSSLPLVLDAKGNVVALRPGQFAETVVYAGGAPAAGIYTLSYDGSGTFEFAPGSGAVLDRRPGRLLVRVAPKAGDGIHLRLVATDPRAYPRNIRLLPPGASAMNAGSFNAGYVQTLRPFRVLRFAAWQQPDPGTPRSWSSRTTPASFTQAGSQGASAEYMIALANTTGADPWFTLPVDASDDYILGFAALVARGLDPRLHPMFEYGNEVWKAGSAANAYASAAGLRARYAFDPATAGLDFYAVRSSQVFTLVGRAFGADAPRAVRVLGGPLAYAGTSGAAVDGALLRYVTGGPRPDVFAAAVEPAAPLTALPALGLLGAAFARTQALAATAGLPLVAFEGIGGSPTPLGSGLTTLLTPGVLAAWQGSGGGTYVANEPSGAASPASGAARRNLATVALLQFAVPPATLGAGAIAGALGLQPPLRTSAIGHKAGAGLPGTTLVTESFSDWRTPSKAWFSAGDACLTAGTATTPASSIAPCNGAAPRDPAGAGVLQLTGFGPKHRGFAVYRTPFSTAAGLQVTFTDYSFTTTARGGDGVVLFFSDASKLMPVEPGAAEDGQLAYGGSASGPPGIANAYVGIGLDAHGTFALSGASGMRTRVPGTIAIRGAAAARYPYLGGATDASGRTAPLPFAVVAPHAATRPQHAPTIRATLLPTGLLTVSVDRHDGAGFVAYYQRSLAGVGGQPVPPASVYVGLSAATGAMSAVTGALYSRQQVADFVVSTVQPATTFAPTQVKNLAAWFDASDASSVTETAAKVWAWNDKSGNGNTARQAIPELKPTYLDAGINGLGSLAFNGATELFGGNNSFAASLFNESTVFVVASQSPAATQSVLLYAGAYHADPHWGLHPSDKGTGVFDFNSQASGRVLAVGVPGVAVWTAEGSVSGKSRFFRKNGNTLASSTTVVPSVAGAYPFAIGAMWNGVSTSSYAFSGQVGEIVAYNRALSASESAQIEGYLACKWGLQNRLPDNHPYRATCPQGGSPVPIPTPTATGSALPDPLELRSQAGQLTFNVTAQADPTTGNPVLIYGGSERPPTLRLSPGDTLFVNLTNKLPTPAAGAGYTNDTNLHYHGLHVSPNAPADDSIDMMAAPGQTLHYRIAIPATHPPGLYWYHSHAHGEAERQNLSGMSGALVIEGIAQYAPQVANMPERILVVRDAQPAGTALPFADPAQLDAMQWAMQHATAGLSGLMTSMQHALGQSEVRGASTDETRNPYVYTNPLFRRTVTPQVTSTHCTGAETASKVWTVNGAKQPSIGIRPGEQQFWRLVNAGSDTYLDVQLDNATMQIVALDGVPLIKGVNTPASLIVSHYVVPPASRVEFIVTGPPSSAPAFLRTNCFDAGPTGLPMPAAVLASINPTSSVTDLVRRVQPAVAKAPLARFHTAAYIKAQAVSATQTVYYSDQLTINGQSYDPAAPPLFYAQSGTVQEWTIVNTDTQVHTFHIHQIHFVLEAIDGITQAQQFMLDNVNVPPATTSGPGSVKVLLDFTDPLIVGTFLVHCHILSHEDAGMMAKIRVGTAPPLVFSSAQLSFASAAAPAQKVTITGGKAPFTVTGCAKVANGSLSGASLTVTAVGAGSCILTVADSSGLSGSISISVAGAASPVKVAPASVSFVTPTSAAQTVAISGGALPYTVSGCTGIVVATLATATLTVTPKVAGTCTLTVSDAKNATASVAVAVNSPATGTASDNLTFHQNALRTGWYANETKLSAGNVTAGNFGLLTTLKDPAGTNIGKVLAQPLYVTNETTADGKTHNLVIVATAADQVYAFDDQTFAVVWHRSFTNPAAGIAQQTWLDTKCYAPSPDQGIIGTPVIDRTLGNLYVVAATKENGNFFFRLHAISIKSGLEAVGTNGVQIGPTVVMATIPLTNGGTATIDPSYNLQRPGLLEANGNIYVGLGSKCDFHSATLHGWMLAYSATTLLETGNAFATTDKNDGTGKFLGSVWMSGFGPAADAAGNIYFATGNGPYDGGANLSMSVIEAPGNLDMSKASAFTPHGEAADSASDLDLGSGGVMLLPDQPGAIPHLALAGGKCGAGGAGTNGCIKYLLNRDKMGGQQVNDAGAVWQKDTAGYMWGGPAYFRDATSSYVVYGGGRSYAPLSTYVLGTPPSLTIKTSQGTLPCLECRLGGAQPVVSSNGTLAGSAVVWALKTPGQQGGPISLYAFNGANMAQILYTGVAGNWTLPAGAPSIGSALISPTIANGRVYVPVDNGVAVFGLTGSGVVGGLRGTGEVAKGVKR